MQKCVNGVMVDMTPAEISERQAEDAAYAQRKIDEAAAPAPKSLAQRLAAVEAELAALKAAPK